MLSSCDQEKLSPSTSSNHIKVEDAPWEKIIKKEEKPKSLPAPLPTKVKEEKPSRIRKGFRKGVALGLFVSQRQDPEYEFGIYKKLLKEIISTGASDLSIPLRWVQRDVRSSAIFPDEKVTVSDAMLLRVIREAKSMGLKIFLMPYIFLQKRGKGEWRGTINPKDRKGWWASYRKFIYHYADIAKQEQVSLFSMGSEIGSMRDPKEWDLIIAHLREELPETALTYSANWDRFETFSFWSKLDLIGISTYAPLSKSKNPSLNDLNQGWGGFKHKIKNLRRRFPKKKILFTEVGYSASRSAAKTPWIHFPEGDVDEDMQALLYTSLLETWSEKTYLEGFYIWNWFGPGGPKDSGFSPRGKKAEKVLQEWF